MNFKRTQNFWSIDKQNIQMQMESIKLAIEPVGLALFDLEHKGNGDIQNGDFFN